MFGVSRTEKAIILLHSSGKAIYKEWRGESIGTEHGEIAAKDVEKGGLVKSKLGGEYLVLPAGVRDRVQNERRGARPIYEYDAGFAAGLLALGKTKRVLEAGTGSASATQVFAGMCESVDTFEREERFYEIAKENIALSGLANIRLTHGDVNEAELERERYDAVFLDLKEPAKALGHVWPALKKGGYACVFTPHNGDLKPVMEKYDELGAVQALTVKLENKQLNRRLAEIGYLSYPAYFISARKFR